MTMTNPQPMDLAALRKVAEAATQGPWDSDTCENEGEYGSGPNTRGGFKSYQVLDGSGRVLMDTLNSDVGCVHEEYDECGASAWDEIGRLNAMHAKTFDPPTAIALLDLIAAQAAKVERLRVSLTHFLNDERFQVAVGGNPNVVERMIAEARAALEPST